MAREDRLIDLYLGSMDLRVVVVLQQVVARRRLDRPCKISFGRRAAVTPKGFDVGHEWWVTKPQHGELLLFKVREEFSAAGATRVGGWIDLEHGEIAERIMFNARTMGANLQSLDAVRARAQAAVGKADQQVDAMRRSGGLRDLNAAYKTYRAECQATGVRAVSYNTWLDRFTTHCLEQLAATEVS